MHLIKHVTCTIPIIFVLCWMDSVVSLEKREAEMKHGCQESNSIPGTIEVSLNEISHPSLGLAITMLIDSLHFFKNPRIVHSYVSSL